MKQLLLLFALVLMGLSSLSAQRNCSSMDVLEDQIQQDPQRLERLEQIEAFTRDFERAPSGARNVITIPVVVNVLYNNSAENVSDAQIQSQIDVLNEDFRRTNGDADNVWPQAADVEIEFCLASTDPSGNATNGIRRKSTGKRDWRTNDDMKKANKGGLDPWPAGDYMNIWVCDIKGGILGYAQFPGGPASTDGIVIDYAYFGSGGSAQAPFDLGRTATHEVGHYLNLRHIWGDGPCSADDFVSDTPNSDGANYGCALGSVSCSSTDMVQNYMDYSDDVCMNLFTAGQSTRMRALFAPGGARSSLANSTACGGGNPPVDPTCDDGIQNGSETGVDCGGPDCVACDPPGACDAPTGLGTDSRQGGRAADLNWSAATGANSYFVEFRAQGATGWSSATTTNTTIRATGLTKFNPYEFRVTSQCTGGSATSVIHPFTAGTSSRLQFETAALSVFPNPANAQLNVDLSELATSVTSGISLQEIDADKVGNEQVDLVIVNANGQVVLTQRFAQQEGTVSINTATLKAGVYSLLARSTDGTLLEATRFVVSH